VATATYARRKRVVQAVVLRAPGSARVQQWRRVTG
jgi:hypothetical protein